MSDMLDFAAPPSEEAPIILGAPPADDGFIGTVDDAGEGAPIILGAPPPEVEGADPAVEDAEEEELAEPAGPTPMQIWNEEWQATLMGRKDNENNMKGDFLAKAKEDMEKFQSQREQKREAKMSKNRADEQQKLEAIEADLENDNSWQQVCKMVELNHDSASADVKRMRDVMIFLKNDTTKAVALA